MDLGKETWGSGLLNGRCLISGVKFIVERGQGRVTALGGGDGRAEWFRGRILVRVRIVQGRLTLRAGLSSSNIALLTDLVTRKCAIFEIPIA